MHKLSAWQWGGVLLHLLVVASNVVCAYLDLLPMIMIAGALIIVLLEVAKISLIVKRFAAKGGKKTGRAVVLAEGVTFLIVLVVLIAFAVPYDHSKDAMLIVYCADFFVARAASCIALSHYFWK